MSFILDPRGAYRRALAGVAVLLASMGVLGGAWFFQYVLGVAPCHLCLLQRWPWYAAALAGAGAAGVAHRSERGFTAFATVAAVALAAGTVLSGYHVGVENGWIAGPSGCTGVAVPSAGSAAEFLSVLKGAPPVVPCDKISFTLFGFSLANWNVLCSAAVSALAAYAAVTRGRRGFGVPSSA